MAGICPECSTDMLVETVHGVNLEVCPGCAGIWFTPDELRMLLAREPEALSELEHMSAPPVEQKHAGPSSRCCPEDQAQLQEYHYLYNSPIVLEACTTCGGFFVEEVQLGKMQELLDQCRGPMTEVEKAKVAQAQTKIALDSDMQRQNRLAGFFNVLRTRVPWWWI